MFSSDLCKENDYCKTVILYTCGLLLLLKTNLEYISRILIFADLYLPRNSAKIERRENFPFMVLYSLYLAHPKVFSDIPCARAHTKFPVLDVSDLVKSKLILI